MMKPLVISKSQKPRAFKTIDMKIFPFIGWPMKKQGLRAAFYLNGFNQNVFVADIKIYLSEKDCFSLLLINNAPGHPQNM